jgi:hypothetical protein
MKDKLGGIFKKVVIYKDFSFQKTKLDLSHFLVASYSFFITIILFSLPIKSISDFHRVLYSFIFILLISCVNLLKKRVVYFEKIVPKKAEEQQK